MYKNIHDFGFNGLKPQIIQMDIIRKMVNTLWYILKVKYYPLIKKSINNSHAQQYG